MNIQEAFCAAFGSDTCDIEGPFTIILRWRGVARGNFKEFFRAELDLNGDPEANVARIAKALQELAEFQACNMDWD